MNVTTGKWKKEEEERNLLSWDTPRIGKGFILENKGRNNKVIGKRKIKTFQIQIKMVTGSEKEFEKKVKKKI